MRAATVRDVEAIAELAARAWEEGLVHLAAGKFDPRAAWAPARVRVRLAADDGTTRAVAELDGEVRGFVVFGPSRDGDAGRATGEIWVLNVHPDAWRRGVGRALVRHALSELAGAGHREATLWTLAGSARARSFYEACGLRPDGAEQRRESLGRTLEVRYRTTLPAAQSGD